MKFFLLLICIVGVGIVSFFLYHTAFTQPTYEGLPTVPCLDYTKPLVENFSFALSIIIQGKPYPLDASIGHDFGNCLHDIHTSDASGKVLVQANDNEQFTLGQFFDVWHKTFSVTQLYTYLVTPGHKITVLVNGNSVENYRDLILTPNQHIEVVYK